MRRPTILVVAGTPGAGKSTQIRLIASELRTTGFKVKATSLASGHLLAYLLAIILAKSLPGRRRKATPLRTVLEERPHILRRLFKLWLVVDTFSVCAKFLLNVYLPSKFGYCVIIEQSLSTTIADYFYLCQLLSLPPKTAVPSIRLMQRLIDLARPTKVVFLDAQTRVLESRWRERTTLHIAEKPEYLCMQRTLGLSLAKALYACEITYINSDREESLTSKELREVISTLFDHSPSSENPHVRSSRPSGQD